MTRFAIVIGLSLAALAGIVLADIAPVPLPPQPVPPDSPAFQLTNATVVATIKPASPTSRPAEQTSNQPMPPTTAPDRVKADVTCDFELTCIKAKDGGETVDIAFPVDLLASRSAQPQVIGFTVETDGKPVATEPLLQWIAGSGSPNYFGYRWKGNAVAGQAMKFKVSYTLLLPVRNGKARFVYVLRSGATWGRPIKQETVTVRPTGGVTLELPPGRQPAKPEKQQDGSLVWKLDNAVPQSDILLLARPAAAAAVIRSILN